MQMAAHPEGADQHQGADRVAGRALDFAVRHLDAAFLRLGLYPVAKILFFCGEVAPQGGGEIAVRQWRPVGTLPRRPAGVLDHVPFAVLQTFEERLPLRVDRLRVDFEPRIKVIDVVGIGAVQKRRVGESRVGVLA